jgi:hypothetical protein
MIIIFHYLLLFLILQIECSNNIIKAIETAVWGGCVTCRSIPADSWFFSRETFTVQGGYGSLFASLGESNKCHFYIYLSGAGSPGSFQTFEMVIYHDKTVKIARKNYDKQIKPTDRARVSLVI